MVEDPAWIYRSGVFFLCCFFIFCHVTENEVKENARVPLHPPVAVAGAHGNSLPLRQSACFNPSAPPMLGAGQWENQNQKRSNII